MSFQSNDCFEADIGASMGSDSGLELVKAGGELPMETRYTCVCLVMYYPWVMSKNKKNFEILPGL